MIKKIFFDLDGTLIDQKAAQNEAVIKLYYKYAFDNVSEKNDFVKKWDQLTELHYDSYLKRECTYEQQRIRRIVDLFSFFKMQIEVDNALTIYDDYLELFERSWRTFDDVKPCLRQLQDIGLEMGIITNGDLIQQQLKLTKTEIKPYFKYIIAAGEYKYTKPNPEIFRIACRESHMSLDEFIYIGDSYKSDIVPCKELNIKCLLLNRSGEIILDKSIETIDSCYEIVNRISKYLK